MHVLQHIAVTAESAEEAFGIVEHKFNEMYSESEGLGGWSDWYVVGGGRWNSNPSNQYKDSWNDVVAFANAPDKFRSLVQRAIENRREEMGYLKRHFEVDTFTGLVDKFIDGTFEDDDRFDMNSYYIKKAASLLNGSWNSDSYFFDLENYSTTPKYMLDSIDNGRNDWYLVPVDFHF